MVVSLLDRNEQRLLVSPKSSTSNNLNGMVYATQGPDLGIHTHEVWRLKVINPAGQYGAVMATSTRSTRKKPSGPSAWARPVSRNQASHSSILCRSGRYIGHVLGLFACVWLPSAGQATQQGMTSHFVGKGKKRDQDRGMSVEYYPLIQDYPPFHMPGGGWLGQIHRRDPLAKPVKPQRSYLTIPYTA